MSAAVAVAKDVFTLLRDLSLFAFVVFLLFFPVPFNSVMTAAGFVKANFHGIEWQARLVDTNGDLQIATNTIADLKQQITQLQAGLAEAEAKASSSQERERFATLQQEAQRTTASAAAVQSVVQETLSANNALIDRAQSQRSSQFTAGYCYQQDYSRAPDSRGRQFLNAERYALHCHATKENCERARGGSTARAGLSACQAVSLGISQWSPSRRGYLDSWFERRPDPFGAPFPPLPQ